MSGDGENAPSFDYEALWYIKLIDDESKNPIEKWGGYSQDFEEAENVYSHEEVVGSDHENWGVVGIKDLEHTSRALLIFDLDVYKAPDFDVDRVTVPDDTLIVRSQSGGIHIYSIVTNAERGDGNESDFEMASDPGWDIDIRGSSVSHHVTAPAGIPGVGGKYEIVGDSPINGVVDPGDAASRITLDGDPLLEYDPASGAVGDGFSFEWDAGGDPPEDMPTCYHRGLQLRAAAPDDHPNTHKVNVLTALCGLAAGYSPEEMVEHFCEDYAPSEDADWGETEYQLDQLAGKMQKGEYVPPTVSTLRDWGILDEDEECSCDIDYHGGSPASLSPDGGDESRTAESPSGFSVYEGRYGVWKETEDGGPYFDEWTNFEIELTGVIVTPEGDLEMSLTIHPRSEDPYDVVVEPTALNEPRSFKQEVCTGATTTFDGSRSDLAKIKQFVGSQDAPRKRGTHHLGYHADGDRGVWVTPSGTLGPDGWVDEPEQVLAEKDITAERKWRLDPEVGDEPDMDAVVEMLELLPETRDSERLLPLLGWFYAAATAPLIMDWEGQFNFASVTGESGSGKTTTISTLWSLMGMDDEPLSADTTPSSLMTSFASTNSIPMWFDEYKPSDMSKYDVDTFHDKLRKATRGAIDQRSNVDLSDTTYRLLAPTVVSGEERIQGSAEERRGVFTSFRQATTEPGTPTAIANAKLTGTSTENPSNPEESVYYDGFDYDDHALAWVMWVCGQNRDELKALWQDADRYVRAVLSDQGVTGLDDLTVQGLQTVRYGCLLYRKFYRDCGGTETVITDEDVDDAITFVVSGVAGGERRRSHLDVFLEVASRAASDGYIEEDNQYTFVRKGSDNEEIRLHLGNTFDKVKKYAKDHDVSDDLLNNKSDYDERLRNEEESIKWLTCRSQQSPPVGSAIGIDTAIADAEIDDFGRWMWDSETQGSQEDVWQPLNTDAEGRINVTFEVTVSTTDTPDSMAEKGVVVDETKSMDYVVWEDSTDAIPHLEEGECYAVKGAKIGRYEDAPQLVLDNGVRDIATAEPGFGYIESTDAGRNSQLSTATPDGGSVEQLRKRVLDVVEEHGPVTEGMIQGVRLRDGDDPEEVAGAVSTLREHGRITDFDGDGYEVSTQ